MTPIALVTGASRAEGLGFETCKQLKHIGCTVLLTARAAAKAKAHADALGIDSLALDVTSDASVAAAAKAVEQRYGRLDILINNASGDFDPRSPTQATPVKEGEAALGVNLFGPWRTIPAFEPLLLKSAHPRIVNISSEASSFGAPFGMAKRGKNLLAYSVSKAALNALTVKFAAAYAGTPIIINAVCPGWIATYPGTADMGARPVADGAKGVVWAATLPDDGPRGGLFRDGKPLAW
jgi:NAD(P)-dependent dehydrogenase (short-subunit alcohol dehydrogenase family)